MPDRKRVFFAACIAFMCCRQLSAGSIRRNMDNYEFSVLDYTSYLLTMWYNSYFNYPFVVQVSIIVILFCCFFICVICFLGGRSYTSYISRRKVYQQLHSRFYKVLTDIVKSGRDVTEQKIGQRLQLSRDDIRKRKKSKVMFQLCRLLVKVRAENYSGDREVLVRICRVMGVHEFLERMFVFGNRTQRLRALQMAQFMMLNLPESVLVRLLDSVIPAIRKEARMYYIWLSVSNPFRFFVEDGNQYEWRPWDALEIHYLLEARSLSKKEMPSLPPVIAACKEDRLGACLIREVGFWGNDEEVEGVKKYMEYRNMAVRKSVIECFVQAHAVRMEPLLMSTYSHQPEEIRISILQALSIMRTGNAVPFFLKVWKESNVLAVKLNVLMALARYDDEGRIELERLKKESVNPDERVLFNQMEAADRYSLIMEGE